MSSASDPGHPFSNLGNAGASIGAAHVQDPSPRIPFWLRLIPFFLSAILFLSAFLALFSPLPIILLGLMGTSPQRSYVQRGWALLACVTNSAIVYLLGGEVSFATYLVFAIAPALVMIELLARQKRIEVVGGGAFLAIAASAGLVILFFAQVHHVHPWGEVKAAVSQFIDYWVKTASNLPVQDPAELEAMKKSLLTELPSAVAVMALIIVWANLTIALRLNPRNIRSRMGLRADFFQTWKAPEWLIWPTILAGATLLKDFGTVTDIGRNFFKIFMAVYAIQGLGILSFFMTRWRVNKFFRTLGYLIAVLIAMPLLLSLGFFDLWFDFRSKFRQS